MSVHAVLLSRNTPAVACLTVVVLMNNVYQSWMHISSFSLSFCQRFSEDECLQPSPTQASTRWRTGTLWTAIAICPDTSRYCCGPSLTRHPGMGASACSPTISWASRTSANWLLVCSSAPWSGRETSLSFPTCRSPTRCPFSGWRGASCLCLTRPSAPCLCMWPLCSPQRASTPPRCPLTASWLSWITSGSSRSKWRSLRPCT